jgi:hypothetical protein
MGIDIDVKRGNPDPAEISTSYVKRRTSGSLKIATKVATKARGKPRR